MKERDPEKLSWTSRFTVIALSFFAFSWLIKLIGGSSVHASLFEKTGFIATGLAVLSFFTTVTTYLIKKKKDLTITPEQD